MNAATDEFLAISRQAVADGNALGKHYGFEEGRLAVMRLLLDEVGPGRSDYVLSLIAKVQDLPNPNKLPAPVPTATIIEFPGNHQ